MKIAKMPCGIHVILDAMRDGLSEIELQQRGLRVLDDLTKDPSVKLYLFYKKTRDKNEGKDFLDKYIIVILNAMKIGKERST